jgi:hypothetical protein
VATDGDVFQVVVLGFTIGLKQMPDQGGFACLARAHEGNNAVDRQRVVEGACELPGLERHQFSLFGDDFRDYIGKLQGKLTILSTKMSYFSFQPNF